LRGFVRLEKRRRARRGGENKRRVAVAVEQNPQSDFNFCTCFRANRELFFRDFGRQLHALAHPGAGIAVL
jgi:hypothetical protein